MKSTIKKESKKNKDNIEMVEKKRPKKQSI